MTVIDYPRSTTPCPACHGDCFVDLKICPKCNGDGDILIEPQRAAFADLWIARWVDVAVFLTLVAAACAFGSWGIYHAIHFLVHR